MNGFSADGIDGVEGGYSSFVPSLSISKMQAITAIYIHERTNGGSCNTHSKFAVAHLLCAAQSLSIRAQKSTDRRVGFTV
jgi:hypothetical protein